MAVNVTTYSKGGRIPYTNSGSAIAEGDIVVLASGASGFVGIAVADIAATTGTGELNIGGASEERIIKTTTKASGEAWTAGQLLYSDGTSITSTSSTTFTKVGRAAIAAASAATTGYFILNAS